MIILASPSYLISHLLLGILLNMYYIVVTKEVLSALVSPVITLKSRTNEAFFAHWANGEPDISNNLQKLPGSQRNIKQHNCPYKLNPYSVH